MVQLGPTRLRRPTTEPFTLVPWPTTHPSPMMLWSTSQSTILLGGRKRDMV